MHQPDFEEFRKLLDELAKLFGKPKPDDETTQIYFRALSNLPFDAVRRAANHHERYGKFFPKPVELRPKTDKAPTEETPESRAKFEAALRYSTETWQIRFKDDPELSRLDFAIARAARIEVTEHESSPQYAEGKRQAIQLANERMALLEGRRA